MTKNYVEGLDGGNHEISVLASFDVGGVGYTLFKRNTSGDRYNNYKGSTDWAMCRNVGNKSCDLNFFDNFEIAKRHYRDLCVLMVGEMGN